MSQIEKLREKFFQKPVRNDMTFFEVIKIAKSYGCYVKTGGKHSVHIVYPKFGVVIPIPKHSNTVQEAYIEELRDLFEKIEEDN